jgi:hypothetical protein
MARGVSTATPSPRTDRRTVEEFLGAQRRLFVDPTSGRKYRGAAALAEANPELYSMYPLTASRPGLEDRRWLRTKSVSWDDVAVGGEEGR